MAQQIKRNVLLWISSIKGEGRYLKFFAAFDNSLENVKKFERLFCETNSVLEASLSYESSYLLHPGTLCVVKSRTRRQWCRARVVGIQDAQVLVAHLLDYGDTERFHVSEIRALDPQLTNVPPLAEECILADVQPVSPQGWSPEAIRSCEQNLLNQRLSGFILAESNGVPIIRVAKPGQTEPFVQRLINDGLAIIYDHSVPNEIHYSGPTFKFLSLELNSNCTVTISHAYSMQHFYVRLVGGDFEFKRLMESLDRSPEPPPLQDMPLIDLPCLVLQNQTYYRALIKEIQHTACKVLLVDFGSILTVGTRDLRTMAPHFLNLPAQAVSCMLSNIQRVTPDDFLAMSNSTQLFTCHVHNIQGEAFIVSLSMMDKVPHITKPQVPLNLSYIMKPLTQGTKLAVAASYICSPHEFYCQLQSCKSDLDTIASELKNASNFKTCQLSDISSSAAICGKFVDDGMWYRAKVLSVTSVNNIEVFFVDYGNTETLNLSDIRLTPASLMTHPIHAYKFKLHDFDAEECSPETLELFESTVLETDTLDAMIKAVSKENTYSVVLSLPNGQCVNDMIESSNRPVLSYPKMGNVEKLYVSCVGTSTFFGQLIRFDQDALVKIQEELNAHCSSRSSSNKEFKVGDFVLCKFSEDGQFYRALVEQAGRVYDIFFVDYGNRAQVRLEDLMDMEKKFTFHPVFGIECSLENCADMTKLEDVLAEIEVQVQIGRTISDGKYAVSFTNGYPGNEAVLRLLQQSSSAARPGPQNPAFRNDSFTNSAFQSRGNEADPFQQDVANQNLDYGKVAIIQDWSLKEIFVSHVTSPSEFFCQVISESSKLQQLRSKINNVYNSLKSNDMRPEKLTSGLPCCALYEEDSLWYRAQIKNTNRGSCEVYFVDYGNTADVLNDKVKTLHPDLFDLPPQALKCSLFNTVPNGGTWKKGDIEAFEEMFGEKSFLGQFVKKEANGVYLVNLLDINKVQEGNLSKDFVQGGHGFLEDSDKLLVVDSVVASTSLVYKQPNVPLGTEDVTVTWVTNVLEFFCQRSSEFSVFKKMMDQIQDSYDADNKSSSIVDRPHSGILCIAKFAQDNAWYRAKVLHVKGNQVHVQYIDYGNTEVIASDKIHYIQQDFTVLPVQAIKCQISGFAEPATISSDKCDQLFDGKMTCTFLSKKDDHYLVNLFKNGKPISEEILQMKLATPDGTVAVGNELNGHAPAYAKKFYQKQQLINVIVSFVDSPRKFWCQEDGSALDDLMAEIESYCTSGKAQRLSNISVNVPCLVKYSEDGSWYRACIMSVVGADQAEVTFVDYGNSEVTAVSEIKEISPDFLELPVQAVECRLHGLPATFEPELVQKFQEVIDNATELMAKVEAVADVMAITLFDQSNPEVEDVNLLESVFGVQPSSIEEKCLVAEVPTGTHPGIISYVNSPSELFVQLDSNTDTLDKLTDKIAEIYKDSALPIGDIDCGSLCCAQYSEDTLWYRAQVTAIRGEDIDVVFIDYGNTDTVSKNSLQRLDEQLLETSPLAIPCQLSGIGPIAEEWSAEAIQHLEEYADGTQLSIDFLHKALLASVTIEKDGKSLCDEMIEMQFAKPISEAPAVTVSPTSKVCPERKLETSKFKARISFVTSFEKFYVTDVTWEEDLDSVTTGLSESYVDASEQANLAPDDIVVGQPYAAKYSADEQWYRAVITDISGSSISILFVDFGNEEICEAAALRFLTPELLKHPPFAMECHFKDLEVLEKQEDITAKLQAFVDEEVEFEVEIFSTSSPYSVNLHTPEGDVISMLVNEGLATVSVVKSEENQNECNSMLPETASEETESMYLVRKLPPSKFSANISYVNTWDDIYITPVELSDELSELSTKVQEHCEDEQLLCLDAVEVCRPCAAKYSEDEMWYRAVVTDVEGDQISVHFIDYGNSDVTSLSQMKPLSSELLESPPFAVKCSLLGFQVTQGFESEVTSKFQSFMDEELVVDVEVLNNIGGTNFVKLYQQDEDLTTQLIQAELGTYGETSKLEPEPELQKEITPLESEQPISIDSIPTDGLPSLQLAERKLDQGKINARICYVVAWDKFFVTSVKWDEEFLSFDSSLKEFYNSPDNEDPAEKGEMALMNRLYAYRSGSDCFRVIVNEVNGDDVTVQCLDYGYSLNLKSTVLQPLSEDFVSVPAFAIECHLSECVPVEGGEADIVARLHLLASEKTEFEMEILNVDAPYNIRIKTDEDFVSTLVKAGLALATLPSPERLHNKETFKDNLQLVFVDDYAEETSKHSIAVRDVKEEVMCGVLKHCEVSEERLLLYIVPNDLVPSLKELQDKLSNTYVNETDSSAVTVGDYCVAKFFDGVWYRALVLQDADDSVLLKSVDYGNKELVPNSDIRKLTAEYSELPQYCLECCLLELCVTLENVQAVENKLLAFESDWKVSPCPVSAHKYKNQICIQSAEVEEIDIMEHLVLAGLASQVFPIARSVDISECDFIGADGNVITVFPLEYSEQRNLLQENLKSHYQLTESEDVASISCSRLYAVCKDSAWYRASIHSVEDNNITADLVDFGIKYTADASAFRLLTKDFCHLTPFCFTGHVSYSATTSSEEFCSNLTALLHGKKITCNVGQFDHQRNGHVINVLLNGEDVTHILLNGNVEDNIENEINEDESQEPNQPEDMETTKADTCDMDNIPNDDHMHVEESYEDGDHSEKPCDDINLGYEQELAANCDNDTLELEVCPSADAQARKDAIIIQDYPSDAIDQEDVEFKFVDEDEVSTKKSPLPKSTEKDDITVESTDELPVMNNELLETVEKDITTSSHDEVSTSSADLPGEKDVEVLNDEFLTADNLSKTTERHDTTEPRDEALSPCDLPKEVGIEDNLKVELDNDEVSIAVSDLHSETIEDVTTESKEDDHKIDVPIFDSDLPETSENDDIAPSTNIAGGDLPTSMEKEVIEMDDEGKETTADIVKENSLSMDEVIQNCVIGDVMESTESCDQHPSEHENGPTLHQELPVGKTEVTVLNVSVENGDVFIEVMPKSLEKERDELHQRLQAHYENPDEVDVCSTIGPCAVLHNDSWYRADILNIDENSINVCHWDFFCNETVPSHSTKQLDSSFVSEPPFVKRYKLSSVKCYKPDAVTLWLQEVLSNRSLTIQVLDNKGSILLLDEENVVQQLLQLNSLLLNITVQSPVDDKCLVKVSYLDCGPNVYLQVSDCLDQLTSLRKKMEEAYETSNEEVSLDKAENGGLYVAKWNGSWERCNVLKKDDTCFLYFLDTGECKPAGDISLRPLHVEFCLNPAFAYPCHLEDFPKVPDALMEELRPAFAELSTEDKLSAEFSARDENGFYSVHLSVHNEDILAVLNKFVLSSELKAVLESVE